MATCVSTRCHRCALCYVLRIVSFMLRIFYHNKKQQSIQSHVCVGKQREKAHCRAQNFLSFTSSPSVLYQFLQAPDWSKKQRRGSSGVSRFLACPLLLLQAPLCLQAIMPLPSTNTLEASLLFREICLPFPTPNTHILLGSMETETCSQRKRDFQK